MMRLARDLRLGDHVITEPEKGRRSSVVVGVRITKDKRPIEISYDRKGTWHYGFNETVEVP
jgi:hypothetical protein